MKVVVDITDALSPALGQLERDLSSTGSLMQEIADDVRDMTQDAMVPGAVRPSNWAPLTKPYGKWKTRRTGKGQADLFLTGNLYASITSRLVSPESSEVFTNVPYADVHQEGNGRIPARPYFPVVNGKLTPYAETRIYSIIDRWIAKRLI